jgi:hypothetical protein
MFRGKYPGNADELRSVACIFSSFSFFVSLGLPHESSLSNVIQGGYWAVVDHRVSTSAGSSGS